jgi:hypothetical protein
MVNLIFPVLYDRRKELVNVWGAGDPVNLVIGDGGSNDFIHLSVKHRESILQPIVEKVWIH